MLAARQFLSARQKVSYRFRHRRHHHHHRLKCQYSIVARSAAVLLHLAPNTANASIHYNVREHVICPGTFPLDISPSDISPAEQFPIRTFPPPFSAGLGYFSLPICRRVWKAF